MKQFYKLTINPNKNFDECTKASLDNVVLWLKRKERSFIMIDRVYENSKKNHLHLHALVEMRKGVYIPRLIKKAGYQIYIEECKQKSFWLTYIHKEVKDEATQQRVFCEHETTLVNKKNKNKKIKNNKWKSAVTYDKHTEITAKCGCGDSKCSLI